MKFFSKLVFILLASLFLVSCGTNTTDSTQSTNTATVTTSGQATGNTDEASTTGTASQSVGTSKASVTITCYYEEPKSAKDKNTIVLGDASNSEYVEIVVQRKIKDFELVNLEYDDSKNETVEKESTNQIKELENKTIVIKTKLAETIPSQKVKWKSEAGKAYEYVIVDDGQGSKNNAAKVFYME